MSLRSSSFYELLLLVLRFGGCISLYATSTQIYMHQKGSPTLLCLSFDVCRFPAHTRLGDILSVSDILCSLLSFLRVY